MPLHEVQPDHVGENSLAELRRRFRNALIVLLATVIVSTIGFVVLGRHEGSLWHQFFLAFWDTLNLVSTVGNLAEDFTRPQRTWAIFVIMFGLGAVLYGFGILQGLLHGGEVFRFYARRKMQRTLESLRDHVILCGFGHVGREVARDFTKSGLPFIIIEQNEAAAAEADHLGHMVLRGDGTRDETLREAGVERAAGLIAALGHDADNVFICLVAQEFNPKLRVVARASRPESRSTLLRAGASRAIVPGELAGLQLSHLILKPQVSEFIAAATGEGEYEFSEVSVADYPRLQGRTLRELNLPHRAEAIVISMIDEAGRQIFNPGGSYVLREKDTMIIVSRSGGVDAIGRWEPKGDA